MKKIFLLLIFAQAFLGTAAKLSPKAQISVVTCGPYDGELYSAFGHSAIHIYDVETGMERLYNYGVFNFDQPNFYLNFAKGHLHYHLATMNYQRFINSYIKENRFVHEQVLNLDSTQRQRLFDYLTWNSLPENKYYYYDYFYDNCATRVRDVLDKVLAEDLQFNEDHIKTTLTIRELCDQYLENQPWGDFAIDLCLGMPMDKEATPWMYQFLPDYVEAALNNASLIRNGKREPLVSETKIIYKPRIEVVSWSWNRPVVWFIIVLLAAGIISFMEWRRRIIFEWFDFALFFLLGLIGTLLFVLWFFTDHNAAANNLNVLWAFPLHIVVSFFLLSKRDYLWLKAYFICVAAMALCILLFWPFWPQEFNTAIMPVLLLIIIRSYANFRLKTKFNS